MFDKFLYNWLGYRFLKGVASQFAEIVCPVYATRQWQDTDHDRYHLPHDWEVCSLGQKLCSSAVQRHVTRGLIKTHHFAVARIIGRFRLSVFQEKGSHFCRTTAEKTLHM